MHRKRDGEQLVGPSQQIVYCDSIGRPVCILEVNADSCSRQFCGISPSGKEAEEAIGRSEGQLHILAARLLRAREEEAICCFAIGASYAGKCAVTIASGRAIP